MNNVAYKKITAFTKVYILSRFHPSYMSCGGLAHLVTGTPSQYCKSSSLASGNRKHTDTIKNINKAKRSFMLI